MEPHAITAKAMRSLAIPLGMLVLGASSTALASGSTFVDEMPRELLPMTNDAERAEGRRAVMVALDNALEDAMGNTNPHVRAELRAELLRVCKREANGCSPVGWHEGDSWAAKRFWEGAVRRGWLSPDTCEEHAWVNDGRWSVAGPWGVSMAYLVRFADDAAEGRGCSSPEDLADVDAMARAVVRYTLALRANGYARCSDRVRVWVGVGKWRKRSLVHQVFTIRTQCGDAEAARYLRAQAAKLGSGPS